MKWITAAIGMFLFASTASAQPTIGTITGTVTNPDGTPGVGIIIQAKNVESGAMHEVRSVDGGQYTLSVPFGAYDLIVPAVANRYDRYEQKNINVAAATFYYADIKLQRPRNAQLNGYRIVRVAGVDRTPPGIIARR